MFTSDVGVVSMALVDVVEEASHSLGQHLTVVGDETVLGVDEEAAKDLQNNILCEAGQCVPVIGGRLHFEEPMIVIVH